MNKYMMALGIFLLAGFAFAQHGPFTNDPWGQTYKLAYCEYIAAYDLLMYAYEDDYSYYDGECYSYGFDLENEMEDVGAAMYGEGGLDPLYWEMLSACESPSSQECSSARSAFYSRASSARSVFRSAKMFYMMAASNTVLASRHFECGNSRADVLGAYFDASMAYRMCLADGGGIIVIVP